MYIFSSWGVLVVKQGKYGIWCRIFCVLFGLPVAAGTRVSQAALRNAKAAETMYRRTLPTLARSSQSYHSLARPVLQSDRAKIALTAKGNFFSRMFSSSAYAHPKPLRSITTDTIKEMLTHEDNWFNRLRGFRDLTYYDLSSNNLDGLDLTSFDVTGSLLPNYYFNEILFGMSPPFILSHQQEKEVTAVRNKYSWYDPTLPKGEGFSGTEEFIKKWKDNVKMYREQRQQLGDNPTFTSAETINKKFEILGLKKDASARDIKERYYILAKKWHPDVNKSPEAAKMFIAIQEAYATLMNVKR